MRLAEHPKAGQFGGVYFTAGGFGWLGSALVEDQADTLVLLGVVSIAAGLASFLIPWSRFGAQVFHVQLFAASLMVAAFAPLMLGVALYGACLIMVSGFTGTVLGRRTVLYWTPGWFLLLTLGYLFKTDLQEAVIRAGASALLMAAVGLVNAWVQSLSERQLADEQTRAEASINQQLLRQRDLASTLSIGVSTLEQSTARVKVGAEQSASAADQLAQSITTLRSAADTTDETVTTATARVAKVRDAVDELDEWSQSIAQTSSLIRSVASQTALLALNAAIEAARAGESGQGFSVVASEVKDLANQTTGSVDEISTIMEGVQAAVAHVSSLMDALDDDAKMLRTQQSTMGATIGEQSDVVTELAELAADGASDVRAVVEAISALDADARLVRQGTAEPSTPV